MIATSTEYERARDELRDLEARLERLKKEHPVGSKGFTKAGIRKLIARLHEELALYEGSEAARQPEPPLSVDIDPTSNRLPSRNVTLKINSA